MGSLSNLYISQSFQSLIHLGSDGPITTASVQLQDGLGNGLGLFVNSNGDISSSGNFYAANLTGSGTTPAGTISSSAQITALGFVSSSITASSLITASFSGNTLTFTKGNGTTFGVVIPDVSGSAGDFVTTASFNSYTASTDSSISNLNASSASQEISINNINSTTASLNTAVGGLNLFSSSTNTSIVNINSTTASLNTSVSNINSATQSLFTSASLGLTTASFASQTLTFTKGDGSTFGIVIPDVSGSTIPSGTVSGSAQITALGFVSSSVTASSLVTASFSGNTLTFTKGDASTFGVVIPDISGSTIPTGTVSGSAQIVELGFLQTSSFNSYTASNNSSISNLNTFTQSQESVNILLAGEIDSLQAKTGSYATTGSNIFVGNQTITGSTSITGALSITPLNAPNTFPAGGTAQFIIPFLSGSTNTFVRDTDNALFFSPAFNQLGISSSAANTSITPGSMTLANSSGNNTTLNSTRVSNRPITGKFIGISGDPSLASLFGATTTNPAIVLESGSIGGGEYYTPIEFQSSQSFSDGRVTFTRNVAILQNLEVTGSLTASLQQGYVLVGDAAGRTTTVATSSFIDTFVSGNLVTTSSFNAYTSSNDQRVSSLEAATSSYVTSAITASSIITASVNNDDITFTKGDGSQFTIQVATGSFALSSSFAETASISRNLEIIARNGNASTLAAGTVVHITSAVGDNPIFNTASFDTELLSANTLGLLRYSSVSGADVQVIVNGIVVGVNTDPALGYVEGDVLYLSSSGQFTKVQPQAPNQIVVLGQVLRAQQNNGSIYVSINNGWELNELHNVQINNPQTGDLIQYESSSYGLWKNKSIVGAGITTTSSFNSYTSSNDQKVNSLITLTGSLATTGSNTFIGNQIISGNVAIAGTLTAYTASFVSVTSSVIVGGNTILLNTFTPAVRYGGIEVIDSGSSGLTGSMLWDSQNDVWLYVNPSGSTYVSAKFISGPKSLTLGSEPSLTQNRIPKADDGDHIVDSQISDDGTTVTVTNAFSASTFVGLGNLTTYSQSVSTRLTNIESTTASLNTSVSNLNTFSSSALVSISNLNASSASQQVSIDNLNTNSASVNISVAALNVFTASQSTASIVNSITELNSFTQSAAVSITNLNLSSGSQQVSIDALNVFTASQSTASLVTSITNLNTFSASALISLSNLNSTTASLLVETSNLNTFSSSTLVSLTNLNSTTASQQISINELNVFTASQSTASLVTSIDNLNQFSASALVSISNLNTTTGSLNTSITNLNSTTASQQISINALNQVSESLNSKTGSYATTGSNNFVGNQNIDGFLTASLQQGYVWVGNASGVSTTVPTSSLGGGGAAFPFTGSAQITGSLGITGSVSGLVNTLAIAASTASLDFNSGNFFRLQLVSGSITHLTATNIRAGQTINLLVLTDSGSAGASGSLTFSPTFKFAGGFDYTPTQITASQDLVSFVTFDTTQILAAQVKNLL